MMLSVGSGNFEIVNGYPDLNKYLLKTPPSLDCPSAPALIPDTLKETNLSTKWTVCNLLQQIGEDGDFKTLMETYQKESSRLEGRDDLAWYLEVASVDLTVVAIFFAISTSVGLVPFVFPWIIVGILGGGALLSNISLIINRILLNKDFNKLGEENKKLIQYIADNKEKLCGLARQNKEQIQSEIRIIQAEMQCGSDAKTSAVIEIMKEQVQKLERLEREQAATEETLTFLAEFYRE